MKVFRASTVERAGRFTRPTNTTVFVQKITSENTVNLVGI